MLILLEASEGLLIGVDTKLSGNDFGFHKFLETMHFE